jgi:hypothetical protein
MLDEGKLLVFSGTDWEDAVSPPSVLDSLSLFGLATSADAASPFAAKLNTALWTAKYAGEGDDGDRRYTLNKEAAGNTLSRLL